MSNPIIEFFKQKGGWMFQKRTTNTNHSYPYHDYKALNIAVIDDEAEAHYVVGESNTDKRGDQHKKFVSKRMIITSTNVLAYIRLNHSGNIEIPLEVFTLDGTAEATYYRREFHTNITDVFVRVESSASVHIYCEGVLPEETRDAE